MPLVNSVSNLLTSSTLRCHSIGNIKSELDGIYEQLRDMRPKVELLAGSPF